MDKIKQYALSTFLDSSYEDAVSKVIQALKEEGFGVLTEIDVKSTLKKKLDVDFRKYVILGACNPPYAHRTLQTDLDVGLLLPCNVIVYETDDQRSYVSAINPVAALEVIQNERLRSIATEVSEKLKKVIERVASGSVSPSNEEIRAEGSIPSLEALVANLSSHNDGIRVKARNSLVAMGKTAVPALIDALKNGDILTRWEAAKSLGEIGDPDTAPALVKALEDDQFDVRWLAAEALMKMNINGLKPLLQALEYRGDSALLREGAHHVFHDLAKGGLRKYLAPILAALEALEPGKEVPWATRHEMVVEVPWAARKALEMLEKEKKT